MDDLSEVMRRLAGPLEVEARRGYPDAAVIGQSIGEYARGWVERAGEVAKGPQKRTVSRIAALLGDYGECDVEGRKQRVEKALRLLGGLDGRGRVGGGPRVRPRRESQAPDARGKGQETRSCPTEKQPAGTDVPASQEPAQGGVAGWLEGLWAEGWWKSAAWVKRLGRLGIETRRDLLYSFARDYAPVKTIADLVDGERAAMVVTAGLREETVAGERRGFRLMRYALEVSDETGKAWVTSFARVPRHGKRAMAILGSPLALNYSEGTKLLIEGAVQRAGKLIEIQHGDSQKLGGEVEIEPGALAPVYALTEGVYQGQIRSAVRRLLEEMPEELPDPLPVSLRKRHALVGLRDALRGIHWPASVEEKDRALKRLAFEELLTLQVALAQRKAETQRRGSGISMQPRGDMVALLEEVLPFSLTRAQQRAIAEIASDMTVDCVMQRMMQGDVGSGKTVVAAAALLIALQSGYQGALMAPTELLAEQHYLVLSRMLGPLGVRVEVLTGSLRGGERQGAYARIADGRAQVVVGTHALIQEGVEFQKLGLVIVDEQHRFGVRQRSELLGKGKRPDMLVMTATPIPRSLALTLYGDLEMSVLDEMPPGRTPVKTRWLSLQQQGEAYEFVRQQIEEGRQAYVVCPLIEESEKLQAEAATKLADQLAREVFPEVGVGLLHGALPVAEKDAVMESFRAGEKAILCATTVVEVGVDVPNATVMVVLNAERFGLAQLHQLRGGHESHCLLLTDRRYNPLGRITPAGEDLSQARGRLKVMLETTDGFRIAEEDLMLRGPGEFYGRRQHGMPDFRLARMARDVGVLEEAREAALWLIEADPGLRRRGHAALRQQVGALRARMDRMAG